MAGSGFQLTSGATTLTEQWYPRRGSSWTHFMMGQIEDWLFRSLAGIRTDESEPGMQHSTIRPNPVGDLAYVTAATYTLYGDISVSWQRNGREFSLSVSIPANCTADIYVPGETEPTRVESGTHLFFSKLKQ